MRNFNLFHKLLMSITVIQCEHRKTHYGYLPRLVIQINTFEVTPTAKPIAQKIARTPPKTESPVTVSTPSTVAVSRNNALTIAMIPAEIPSASVTIPPTKSSINSERTVDTNRCSFLNKHF